MKAFRKSLLGLVVVVCLATGCDISNFDEIDRELREQIASGGSDEDPCRRGCDY